MQTNPYQFDLTRSLARFEAWWSGGKLDRPLVCLGIEEPAERTLQHPRSHHATLRDRWMDVEFQVSSAISRLESRINLGDSLPSFVPNVGPDLVSTLFGAELVFGESTSWCQHVVREADGWAEFAVKQADFDNPYWQTIEAMITRAAERFEGRFFIAMPDLHGSFDILSGVRGPEELCLDLMDAPELVRAASLQASRVYVEAFHRLHQRLSGLGQPSTTWCSYLHRGPAYIPSCDFWCLVSREVAADLIIPTIELEMAPMERTIFHLDGPNALHQLDLVLNLPGLNAVQWVYGAGHGPAANWLPVYRRIREAGKSVQVVAEDANDALTVLHALGPDGVWLLVGKPFRDTSDAIAFLDTVQAASA